MHKENSEYNGQRRLGPSSLQLNISRPLKSVFGDATSIQQRPLKREKDLIQLGNPLSKLLVNHAHEGVSLEGEA